MDRPPEPDLVARFRADCLRIVPLLGTDAENRLRFGLAVSGGADSLALLLLAHAAFPGQIEAASVDHGLRPESPVEAQSVADICADLGVHHAVFKVALAPGNLQAQARVARYRALGSWCTDRGLAALATGHHADDQAETLLMRLNRSSGVAGLAGVRSKGSVPGCTLPVIRPLLGWRRSALADIVQAGGYHPVHDPSNNDPKFDRVQIRQAVKQANWLDIAAIAQSADNLADAADALGFYADQEWQSQVTEAEGVIHYRPQAPNAVRLMVLARAVAKLGSEPRRGALAPIMRELKKGKGGNIAGVWLHSDGLDWTLQAERPRKQ